MDKWDEKVVPALQQAGISSFMISAIKMLLPQDAEGQVAITQQYMGEPAVNLYIFHSEANENERPEVGQALADAVYEGMNGLIGALLGPVAAVLPTFKKMAHAVAEVPVQSLVEDKTQWQSERYADVTDDLHPILVINDAGLQGVEQLEEESSRAVKYIQNGQLLIQKGKQIYTPQGQRIAQ